MAFASHLYGQLAVRILRKTDLKANTRYLIKSKLGVSSDIELVRLALRQRIIDVAEFNMDAHDVPNRLQVLDGNELVDVTKG